MTPSEFRSQPWKNGGGVTSEIVRWPDSASGPRDDYEIRCSLAEDRTPAAFSRFPGYRRWSFLAGPAPITLDVGGVVHELIALGDHIEVPGDAAISCELPGGPTKLFNVLVRDGVAAQVGHGPCPWPIQFAFALSVQPGLPAEHAMICDPPELIALDRHAVWLRWPR